VRSEERAKSIRKKGRNVRLLTESEIESKSSYKLEEVKKKKKKDAQVELTRVILTHFLRLI
jgi:hypothetical protein